MTMNLWDFGSEPNYAATGPTEADLKLNLPEAKTNWYDNLLNDPNITRFLGETGAAISSGTPIMQALGTGAANVIHNRAVQNAGQQQLQQQKTYQQQLLEMAANGTLLSDPSDNTRPDTLTIGGDGRFKLSGKYTPQQQQFMGEQSRLESYNPPGGQDLPDFHWASLG